MNRRLALAASVAGATVLLAGAVMVGALLSVGPEKHEAPVLAVAPSATVPGTVTSLDPAVVYQDEYEYVVTGGQAAAATAPQAGSGAQASGGGPAVAPAPAAAVVAPSPTTVAPRAATTTTTRPEGVPADWPADEPIPPMPAGCRQPQLEDDGVWNCQH